MSLKVLGTVLHSMLYGLPLGGRGVDPMTSDNTLHLTPNQTHSSRVHLPLDTVNHKMHKIWSVDFQENY